MDLAAQQPGAGCSPAVPGVLRLWLSQGCPQVFIHVLCDHHGLALHMAAAHVGLQPSRQQVRLPDRPGALQD